MGFFLFTSLELLLFALGSMVDFKDKKQVNILASLMFVIMFAFAGLRGSGDADYYNYLWFVKDIGSDVTKLFDFTYPVEFAFRFFAILVNFFGISRQWVIVIMNLLSILPIAYVVIKESKNPFLSAIIFLPIFIQFDMQTSRTATAIGLGFMSAYMMVKNKYLLSILFFIFSVSFHKSAFIILPFIILLNFRIGNGFKLITVLIAFGVSIFSMSLFRLISRLVGAVGLSVISRKIDSYVFSGMFAFPMRIYDPRIIFGLMVFAFSIMYYTKDSFAKDSMNEASSKAMWYGLIVFLIFRASTAIAFRFGNFFTIYQVLFIPLIIDKARRIDKLGLFIIILSIIFFILPYALFLMNKAPAYDFFFTNANAIFSLTN
ncbi:MAG: EpsG family protein [Anaerococcus sp.]|nr:EpsG family protein [Anaerococcus sp.]